MILALFALLCLCLLTSGLLSGSETGLYAVSRPRLRLRASAGDRRAQRDRADHRRDQLSQL